MSFVIYKSVDAIIKDLMKRQKETECANLLRIYNETCAKYTPIKDAKKHPLIVLEGLDGCGKSTAGNKLANFIGGVKIRSPPESLDHLRNFFNSDSLRIAFYSLGNYILAMEISEILKNTPVVLDRFWHSTVVFSLAQSVQNNSEKLTMPPEGDDLYKWPEDLLKPDIVLFLNVDEHIRLQRISRRAELTSQESLLQTSEEFRNNVLNGYKMMYNPKVERINANLYMNKMLKEMKAKVEHLIV